MPLKIASIFRVTKSTIIYQREEMRPLILILKFLFCIYAIQGLALFVFYLSVSTFHVVNLEVVLVTILDSL